MDGAQAAPKSTAGRRTHPAGPLRSGSVGLTSAGGRRRGRTGSGRHRVARRAADPDPTTRAQIDQVLERADPAELDELFGAELEFGTAGLRAALGPGRLEAGMPEISAGKATGAGIARDEKRESPAGAPK